jgi:hypothetical protein
MKATLRVMNEMVRAGVLVDYAVAGAVASFFYLEVAMTEDVDVLVVVNPPHGRSIVTMQPVFDDLAARGYREFRKEGLLIEDWPVQFLPVADALDAEALQEAVAFPYRLSALDDAPEPVRVLRAEHLVAIALRTGRPKDRARVAQFAESGTLDGVRLRAILERHSLLGEWQRWGRAMDLNDPWAT